MKMLLVTIASLLATGTFVALVVPSGDGWSDEHTARMRGRNAYYETSENRGSVPAVNVRVRSDREVWLQLGFNFTFRKGRDIDEVALRIEERMPFLRDALFTHLPERTHADLETREGKLALKRWLLKTTQEQLFPDESARVERVYLDPLYLQIVHVQ